MNRPTCDRETLLQAWGRLTPRQQGYVVCALHGRLPERTEYLITKMLMRSTRPEAVIAASMAKELP